MRIIHNWENRPLRCFFCHTSIGVKWEVDIPNPDVENETRIVYACDRCAHKHDISEKEKEK